MGKVIRSESQYSDYIAEELQRHVLNLSNKVWDGLIDRSPVLTGNFRYNWNMTKNAPSYKYEKVGSIESPINAPKRPRLSFEGKEFPIIYIVNNAPYADRIEHGWSKRYAPHGVVSVTLASINI